jgi:molybdate transport system ATP-binding protein
LGKLLPVNNGIVAQFQLAHGPDNNKSFLLDIEATIPGQGITAIFGPSGSGKTSFLRCVAGLEKANLGHLTVNADVWQSTTAFVPPHKRSLGYVFQEASLFDHLTVMGNLAYAIKRAKQKPNDERLEQVINVMDIKALLTQMPNQLSGGEKQRVAMARAILKQPSLLLMDEPLASLDSARKQEILHYLEQLHSHFNTPILYVSHSVEEVVRLADHVLLMEQGKIIAQGSPTELFSRLDLSLGAGNEIGSILECTVIEKDNQWDLIRFGFNGGVLMLPDNGQFQQNSQQKNQRVRVLASDVSITLSAHTDTSIVNLLSARVAEIVDDKNPAMSLVKLQMGSSYLLSRLTKKSVHQLDLKVGMSVWAQIKSAAVVR